MAVTDRYRSIADLPAEIPVFPLTGCILLPHATLPLNVFEPRYLSMVEDAIAGARVLGIIQPAGAAAVRESPAGKAVQLRRVGCAGRLTAFEELPDGRYGIVLTGVVRFEIATELETAKPYRLVRADYRRFESDLAPGEAEAIDRKALVAALEAYLEARRLQVDWDAIGRSGDEQLVNALAIASPYGAEEKQALLEAPTLAARVQALIALARMELASGTGDPAGDARRRLQ